MGVALFGGGFKDAQRQNTLLFLGGLQKHTPTSRDAVFFDFDSLSSIYPPKGCLATCVGI